MKSSLLRWTPSVGQDFKSIKVFSRSLDHREKFVKDMSDRLNANIEPVDSAREAVKDADVLICATDSPTPVFDPLWLKPGVHVNCNGLKLKIRSELDVAVLEMSTVIAADSLIQFDKAVAAGQGVSISSVESMSLAGSYVGVSMFEGTPFRETMIELGDIVAGKKEGRYSEDDITLFCSSGLGGADVAVANEALFLAEVAEGV